MGKLPAAVAPQASHRASMLRRAVSRSRLGKLLKPAAAQLHKLAMVFPLVKHLTQPALLQRNAAPALALRLGISHERAHLLHLFQQLGGRLGPM